MYFNNRRPATEPVYADTVIWQCSECNCWSRKEFVSDDNPKCPMCNSKMHEETKKIRIE
ncbi:cold-shock protein [Alicyclobacillus fastidiosus]|uniref:Cold-shock protein n=1 Tax=Alicyclobacillus fastidiosus TaxID=392011 RepID=A0ABY6ZM02_9BACL|nr:cold-inducible protein YdjO-related protein [Alicyclobacillus fastidiosus]WAH42995.1 cold-shock protein [Alicyclobacillus fastidiosus]